MPYLPARVSTPCRSVPLPAPPPYSRQPCSRSAIGAAGSATVAHARSMSTPWMALRVILRCPDCEPSVATSLRRQRALQRGQGTYQIVAIPYLREVRTAGVSLGVQVRGLHGLSWE